MGNTRKIITPKGEMSLYEASSQYGIAYHTLLKRFERNVDADDMLIKPNKNMRKNIGGKKSRKGVLVNTPQGLMDCSRASIIYGIRYNTLLNRHKAGLSGNELVAKNKNLSTITTSDGKFTRKEAAAHYGIPINTIHMRIHKGLKGDAIVATPEEKRRIVVFDGYEVSVNDLADSAYERQIWLNRLSRGWTVPETLLLPIGEAKREIYLSAYGYLTLNNLAEALKISKETLVNRLDRGWSFEDTFNTPPYGIRNTHFILAREHYRTLTNIHKADRDRTINDLVSTINVRVKRIGKPVKQK